MTSPQTTRLRSATVKIINKVGVQVTWRSRGIGAASSTGYAGNVPTWTNKTITVSLQPLSIEEKLLNFGYIDQDERNIICKYTDIVKQTDEIIWNSDTYKITSVQDVPAFGDSTSPGVGDIIVYLVTIKRSPTGA